MNGSVAGLLRRLVHAVPRSATGRLLRGPLRGARRIAGASNAGCWLGSYEAEVQELLALTIGPGGAAYDVGANVGFFTLLASRLAGPTGRVYAFEPVPENLRCLRRHLALNDVRNVEVVEAAVCDAADWLSFTEDGSHARAATDGTLRVRSVALGGARVRPRPGAHPTARPAWRARHAA